MISKNIFKKRQVPEDPDLEVGQKIIYKNEEATVVHVKPLLVIKTKSGIVCGNVKHLLSRSESVTTSA